MMWGKVLAAVLILVAIVGVATAIEADTSIYLTPSSEHVSFYTSTTYFCCNYTNAESASVTIQFELFNDSSNAVFPLHTLSDIVPGTTAQHNFSGALIATPGKYRVAMYAHGGSELCAYWISVRSPTSPNYEKLHGSTRFKNADGVPSVSFVEPMSGRGATWTTDGVSLAHSLELYAFSAGSNAATGTLTFTNNTTDGETVNIGTDCYEFDTNGNVASGNIAVSLVGGAAANGVITFSGGVSEGETVSVGIDCYEFDTNGNVTSGNIAMNLSTSGTPNMTQTNAALQFTNAVTASDTAGVGASRSGSIVTLTADTGGTAGNSITTTETCANAAFGTATLTGGTASDITATNAATKFTAAVTASDTVGVGASRTDTVVTLTADSPGTSSNSIATTETCAHAAFASATLTGGSNIAWTAAAGGNCTRLAYKNTTGNETNWVRSQTYTLGQSYMLLIYGHDHELLDMHVAVARIPTGNVVKLIAIDVETREQVMLFTGHMMDTMKTSTSGAVIWTNVTNGEHLITVTADGYATGTTTIFMANSYINATIYLQRQSPYFPPHWVRFYLTNIMMQHYSNVNVTVNYVSAAEKNITLTAVTGTDGAVTFLLTPTFRHTITFTNASQGIDKTIYLYPKDTEYWIIAKTVEGGWADYDHDPTRYIHITVAKHEIDSTHAIINVTYLDDLSMTTALQMWVTQTNTDDILGDEIIVGTWDAPANTNSVSHSFPVTNYRGQDYMVHVCHEHNEFGTTYTRAVRFIGILVDLGLPSISYAYISFAILFFMAAMFGATSTSIGGITTCVTGWLLYAIGWLGIIGIVAPICLALASTYAVGVMLTDRARKGGYA